MNQFINEIFGNDEEYIENRKFFQKNILTFQGCIKFLKKIDVCFAWYYDNYEKNYNIAIKETNDNLVIYLVFNKDEKFTKIFNSIGEQGNSFENMIGIVLLNHFQPFQFKDLHIHWGSNTITRSKD